MATRELVELATKVLAKHAPSDGLTDREALLKIGRLFIGPKVLAKRGDPYSRLVEKAENVVHQNATMALTDAKAIDELYCILDGKEANELLAKKNGRASRALPSRFSWTEGHRIPVIEGRRILQPPWEGLPTVQIGAPLTI